MGSTAAETLRRDINGLMLPGFNGAVPPPWVWEAAAEGLAGVLLFAHNASSPEDAAELGAQLHRRAPDLLVSADEEGGDVTRVQSRTGSFLPGACALGQADDVVLTHAAGLAHGRLMRAVGVDLPLTPVLDVASQSANPVIGVRSFGPDPALVARHGAATVSGLARAGVAACAKHFPGHGDTTVDSHVALPTLDIDEELLHARDIHPFAEVIDAGVDMVMTGHLVVPALGPLPASLEPAAAAQLRQLGHTGPVVTDALDMAALHHIEGAGPGTTPAHSVARAAVLALAGGADLLCLGSTEGRDDAELFHTVRTAIEQAVAGGELDRAGLAISARRNRALVQQVRARQHTVPAPELSVALAELEKVGARGAAAAVRTDGEVRLRPGDALVDLRGTINQAAGRTDTMAAALTTRGGLVPLARRDVPTWGHTNPGRRVAALTAHGAGDELAFLLQAGSDVVVLHTGVPGAAPRVPNLVLAHGAGLANAREVLLRCTQ